MTYQTSPVFTGLSDGSYEITAVDANASTASVTTVVKPAIVPTLTINCPPDVYDTLDFGSNSMKISPDVLGNPTTSHSLDWAYLVSNNIPFDSVYFEGNNEITWKMKDEVCGYEETCVQHVYVAFPQCPDAVDCEGNVYHGVRIGCECWTERNLESTSYGNPGA